MSLLKFVFFQVVFLFFFAFSLQAVSLPNIFQDHMVLQQNEVVKIWGWGKPFEKITISFSWTDEKIIARPDSLANWMVEIKTPIADNQPQTITLEGHNTITLSDVLMGEVWLCSGQSNMEWNAKAGIKNMEAVEMADFLQIRFFQVGHRTADHEQIDLDGTWQLCTPETARNFSAVAYFFGQDIHRTLDVPVGLIQSAWGGTPAEVWTPASRISGDDFLRKNAEKIKPVAWWPVIPGKTYNTMVAPLTNFKIKGSLWYQGEGNVENALAYDKLLTTLIDSWRQAWRYDFPFYYVQIAPYKYGRPIEGAVIRDAQRKVLSVENTGMIVISDIGNIDNIHPKNKLEVGHRLANLALNRTYGFENINFSGPIYRSMEVEENRVRIYFDHTEKGLICKGDELDSFQIAGPDKQFHTASAKIDGNTVVVTLSKKERNLVSWKTPVAVRFAFSNTAEPNLFNGAGLPASCFRTDDWVIEELK